MFRKTVRPTGVHAAHSVGEIIADILNEQSDLLGQWGAFDDDMQIWIGRASYEPAGPTMRFFPC